MREVGVRKIVVLSLLLLAGCGHFESEEKADASSLLERSRELIVEQDIDNAMEFAVQALSEADESNDKAMTAEALCTVSTIDLLATRDAQSWEKACEAEQIARSNRLPRPLCEALILKGRVCSYSEISEDTGRNDEAIGYLSEAYQVSNDNNLFREHVQACYHLSEIYVNKNRWNKKLVPYFYQKAEEYLGEGERMAAEKGFTDLSRRSIPFRIRFFRQGGKINDAIDYCARCLTISDPSDWLTKAQIYDQLTSLYGDQGKTDMALDNHRSYVHAMQKYMRGKSDKYLQDLENQYAYLVKQHQIERTRRILLVVLALLLMSLLLIWQSLRYNRKISRQKAAIEEADASKKNLLEAISSDLVDVTSLSGVNEMMELARNSHSMDEDEIRQSVEKLVGESASLSEEVSEYFYKLILHRKKAVEQSGLTERELEVLRLSAQGLSAAQIADILHISTRTVTNHKQNIYVKMGVNSTSEMVFKAKEAGLL